MFNVGEKMSGIEYSIYAGMSLYKELGNDGQEWLKKEFSAVYEANGQCDSSMEAYDKISRKFAKCITEFAQDAFEEIQEMALNHQTECDASTISKIFEDFDNELNNKIRFGKVDLEKCHYVFFNYLSDYYDVDVRETGKEVKISWERDNTKVYGKMYCNKPIYDELNKESNLYRNFRNEQCYNDVKIQVNGEDIGTAHRIILAARSSKINSMENLIKESSSVINFECQDKNVVKLFIDYLYGCDILPSLSQMKEEQISEMISLAKDHGCEELFNLCEWVLNHKLGEYSLDQIDQIENLEKIADSKGMERVSKGCKLLLQRNSDSKRRKLEEDSL